MINKDRIGLNKKYLKLIPVAILITCISLLLPFINISQENFFISGVGFIDMLLINDTLMGNIIGGLLIGSILLLCIGFISSLILPCKKTSIFSVIAFIISAITGLIILFTITKMMNNSGLITTKFQVHYLGIGYWAFIVLNFVGMVIAMKAAKINPGYIVLIIMSIIWLFPIAWIIMTSFRGEPGSYTSYFWPKDFTFKNYYVLLTDSSQFPYMRWFANTLFVATCSCAISTFLVLSTSFTLSRIRFQGRRFLMNLFLILGMFPGFMSMIAVYYILKGMGLTQSLTALILVYSGGSALGYYISKGFFDTIPKALDEAAFIDGATKWHVFTKITLPLSKPIIIYTILTSFMGPWADYIFARVIIGDDYKNYTVALGLYTMLERNNIDTWYTRFAAGAVLISIPIAFVFISLQKYYVEGLSGSVKG